jgi:hypothetical protein
LLLCFDLISPIESAFLLLSQPIFPYRKVKEKIPNIKKKKRLRYYFILYNFLQNRLFLGSASSLGCWSVVESLQAIADKIAAV